MAKPDIADAARKSGIDEAILRSTARTIAQAEGVAIFEDLGVQMNRHSTLVSYLQRLLSALCGHFGKPGTHYTSNGLGNLGAGKAEGFTPVSGARIISGLVPCTAIPGEILTDHPDCYRAMIIESGNPVHSLPDSPSWREALRALECSVVIDVAMTATAREADYVLPATSQYEKAEATFFNFEFPDNYFHVRKPLFQPPAGPLDEAEIHMRLAEALGGVPEGIEAELLAALAQGREHFRNVVFAKLGQDPNLMRIAPGLLYRTLGTQLPEGMQNAAALWAVCHQHAMASRASLEAAGITGEGMDLGDALFDALIENHSGVVISREQWNAVWQRAHDGQIQVALSELLADAATLDDEEPCETSDEYPYLLSAGERRTYTANTIFSNPEWRRKDADGALYLHPEDAARLNLGDGSNARITTQRGSVDVIVEMNERMMRGHMSLPNGMGILYPDENGVEQMTGTAPNEITWSAFADEYVGTPWHKSVPVRVEAID